MCNIYEWDDHSKTASNFTLDIKSLFMITCCATWPGADLRNCLVPNIVFVTPLDVSGLIKCLGFKLEPRRIGSMLRAT